MIGKIQSATLQNVFIGDASMKKIQQFINLNTKETIDSVKNFKKQPLKSVGQILPVMMVLLSFIGLIHSIMIFASNNGYSNQIEEIKNGEFFGFMDTFTAGSTEALTHSVFYKIIIFLLLAELLVLLISILKEGHIFCKIVAVLSLIAGAGVSVFAGFVLGVFTGRIRFSYEEEQRIAERIKTEGIQISEVVDKFQIVLFVGCLLLLLFVLISVISGFGWIYKKNIQAILISYIIFPIILWFSQNLVPIQVGIVVIAITFVLGGFFIGTMANSIGDDSGGSYSDYSEGSCSTKNVKKVEKTNQQKEWGINRPARLFVESDFTGTKVIRAYGQGIFSNEYNEPIYYNLVGEPTLYEFKKGDLIITIQGRRMSERDLHYK